MDPDPVVMGVSHGTLQLTVREVPGERTGPEILTGQIDCVTSSLDGGRETVRVPCRR